MKKLFCCPALELFHCLPQWKTGRLHGKKLQNATNDIIQNCTLGFDWVLKKDKEISNRAIIKSPHALHCVCFSIQTMKTVSFS
jgi:hypothetical protein